MWISFWLRLRPDCLLLLPCGFRPWLHGLSIWKEHVASAKQREPDDFVLRVQTHKPNQKPESLKPQTRAQTLNQILDANQERKANLKPYRPNSKNPNPQTQTLSPRPKPGTLNPENPGLKT